MSQTTRQIKRGRDTKIPQSSGPPEKVSNEAVHKELSDRMERDTTTASSLEKSEGSKGFHQIIDFLTTSHIRHALTESPTIYVSLIEQFWQTATTRTLENGDMEITATIDGKVKIVSEASIRRHLKLEDSDGISDLPTTEIFEQLALMGADEAASTGVDVIHGGATTTISSLDAGQGGDRVAVLENDLKQTKKTYGATFTKLIKKERKIAEIDEDPDITLFTAPEEVYTAEPDISTANVPVSTAGAEVSTAAESLVYIRRSAAREKDKGKAIVEESEPTQNKTKI
ncbi:hypothetical protein Tco_0838901 [Tanacetum coccineum]|uniref:Uncharacterized protein n=1 Tax=Tanacetum coccineum TaxID=301880 RepID=A0ABQ5ATL6_9ASTR